MRARRVKPRRRVAPRWTAADWQEANRILLARSGARCECCGEPLNGRAERHHRVRRRDGGDAIPNLLLLLPEHHHHWTLFPAQAVERGIIVPTWGDPARTPVLHLGRRWCLLTPDGGTVTHLAPAPGQTPVRTGETPDT